MSTPTHAVKRHLEKMKGEGATEINKYLKYKAHVCRQVYANADLANERLAEKETAWPEYETSCALVSRPEYLTRRDNTPLVTFANAFVQNSHTASSDSSLLSSRLVQGQAWLKQHLGVHVQELQEYKQHHVHLPNEKGERVPLTHCRRPDNPSKCKSDFPRTLQLIERAVVLCHGLLAKMSMPSCGRRSKLGSLHGPMNQENLNGTASAMLAVQQCNSDVQLPYRVRICRETHSHLCQECCVDEGSEKTIVEAMQCSQDAQAGYACDYCSKRQPMAFNEVKECCKGHSTLSQHLEGERTNYAGKRHAGRFMSDAYGKGVVRGQAESTNLRVYAKANAVTSAETMKASTTQSFYGREFLETVERLNDGKDAASRATFAEIDGRNARKRKITIRDVALLYGQRPKHAAVWHLSPYEFTMYWEPKLAEYPLTMDMLELEDESKFHVRMTFKGKQ